ncbi:unnamed protein product, partial [Ilex paraguariensis]
SVLYSVPLSFKNSSKGNASSFSTMFVFSIVPEFQSPNRGFGMSFSIIPTKGVPGAESPSKLYGLLNKTVDGDPKNHAIAVEFGTSQLADFGDTNDNHVALRVNSIKSTESTPAGYFTNGEFRNLNLASGEPIQAWVDYDGTVKQLNVTISPLNINKPDHPLVSTRIDLSPVFLDEMFVGFIAVVGANQSQYVLGWSFQLNGKAKKLDLSRLPTIPLGKKSRKREMILAFGYSFLGVFLLSLTIFAIFFLIIRRKAKLTEILEDWEVQYGPHRFLYKDLFVATKGFRENELLGRGGFGRVYRGVLPVSNMQVGVKRISHDSRQGMREFVAEIATIGRLRHPNLVRLLGYCRQKEATLNWNKRFKIIKDVASGLSYLHEEWVEVIIHRDIKASNVLLDGDFNGKLGDFGLARCSHRDKDSHTTDLAGTLGYIAPELTKHGKATTSTDMFAFGTFCLEVACGRRPVDSKAPSKEVILVDWVLDCLIGGKLLKMADPKLKNEFEVEEMLLVLKVGLLCSHPVAAVRPSISQVLLYLKGYAPVPENLDALLSTHELDAIMLNHSVYETKHSTPLVTVTEELTGR